MTCFSKQILDYFYNIQNTGRILKPEAIGKAGSKKEGTVIEFSWRVKDGIIEDARFRTFGDVNAIAISSIITTMMIGKSINDVLNITAEDVLEHLQSNEPNYLYIIDVALNALINTYENYLKKYSKTISDENKVNEFAVNLRQKLEKIESGDEVDIETYDLSNIAINETIEDSDEDSYLQNLQAYNKNVEENSIEKSLTKLLQGYTSFNGKEEKEVKVVAIKKSSNGKRGRPRKERTPEELEALANKVSRGRGRPRKERSPEEIEAEFAKIKRGRGRPRKEVDETPSVVSVVRGRGRPRKERTPEELEAEKNKVKRGRGRPKKEKSQEELERAQEAVRRGRGRPRKNEVFNLFDNETEVEKDINHTPFVNTFAEFDDDDLPITEDEAINTADVLESDFANVTETLSGHETVNMEVKKGRGRPRKERTQEELAEMANKVVRGRGRPKKEKTPEELEAEKNKVKRGRGRPKKIENSVFGIMKLSKGNESPEQEKLIEEKQLELPEDKVEETVEPILRGRGRPRKEKTPEELEAEKNKIKRGRGRPRKESMEQNFGIGAVENPAMDNEPVPHQVVVEDSEHHFVTLENNFAPAQNKYGVGVSKSTQYNVSIKKTKITKHFASKVENEEQQAIDNKPAPSEIEEEKREPLSDNVNNVLKNSSIQDALRVLLGEDEE